MKNTTTADPSASASALSILPPVAAQWAGEWKPGSNLFAVAVTVAAVPVNIKPTVATLCTALAAWERLARKGIDNGGGIGPQVCRTIVNSAIRSGLSHFVSTNQG